MKHIALILTFASSAAFAYCDTSMSQNAYFNCVNAEQQQRYQQQQMIDDAVRRTQQQQRFCYRDSYNNTICQ